MGQTQMSIVENYLSVVISHVQKLVNHVYKMNIQLARARILQQKKTSSLAKAL